ncbi:MAG: hypothetical protein R3D55_03500 [Chloroflexota bacterium]
MRLLGWRFAGTVPNLPKMVLIGAPRQLGFSLAMVALFALNVRVYDLGKHTFNQQPFEAAAAVDGGVAVDRRAGAWGGGNGR